MEGMIPGEKNNETNSKTTKGFDQRIGGRSDGYFGIHG
jgi:hypothetical protein